MKRYFRWSLLIVAALLLVVSFVDVFIWRTTPQHIIAGEPFVYWSHVNQVPRAWWMLLWVIIAGLWLFLRKLSPVLLQIRWLAMLMLTSACCLFSLAAPMSNLTQLTRHIETVRTEEHTYHLYYQYTAIGDVDCDYVVVRCDRYGIVCTHIGHWLVSPVCLNQYANIRLTVRDTLLTVIANDEIVFQDAVSR